MIDVVYSLGTGSKWNNNEIRYSVRSVEKHLKNFRRIYIVGEDPGIFNADIRIIPCPDKHKNKARNIMDKITAACNDERISDDFIFFNDDYFLMKDLNAPSYPYYHKCKLMESILMQKNDYILHLKPTYNELVLKGFKTHNFDVHKPIIYNKEKFLTVMSQYNWDRDWGFVIRSLYCNTLGITGERQLDHKCPHAMMPERWERFSKDVDCFSIDDRSVNKHFEQFINKFFPNKSRYEL